MKYFLIILFLISQNLLFSQSVIFTTVSIDDYPQVDCNYLILDENNNKVVPSQSDLRITENGIPQEIINYKCDNPKQPEPISVVLTLDNSASMLEGVPQRYEVIRKAAKSFIDILTPQSEVAVTYFTTSSDIAQTFTNDKQLAKNAIDNIPEPIGGTFLTEGFLGENTGALSALKGAKNRKVIVFLTDGSDPNFNAESVLSEIKDENITIYTIAVDLSMDKELKRVAEMTNGLWFDNIYDSQKVETIYNSLALLTQGIEPCIVSYLSNNCELDRNIRMEYENATPDEWQLNLEKNLLVEYSIFPREIRLFKTPAPDKKEYINIVSHTDSLIIDSIFLKYKEFSILNEAELIFPIELKKSEKLTLVLQSNNTTSNKNDLLVIRSNSCQDRNIPIYYIKKEKELQVTTPNGGEIYYVGSQLPMEWDDSEINKEYNFFVSTNAGINWDTIAQNYNAKDYILDETPNTPTDEALFKVEYNEPNIDIIRTNGLGTLIKSEGDFDKLHKIDSGKYLAVSTFRSYFEYKNLIVDSTLQSQESASYLKYVFVILDKNLNPLKHKVFRSDMDNFEVASIDGKIYVLAGINRYIIFDDKINISYTQQIDNEGVLFKLDSDLEYIDHKKITSNNSGIFDGSRLYGFESYGNKLFAAGTFGIDIIFDADTLADTTYYTSGVYILRINEDLTIDKFKVYDNTKDGIQSAFYKLKIRDENTITFFGTANSSILLNLPDIDMRYHFTAEYDILSEKFTVKSKIRRPFTTSLNEIDFERYKDITYYLVRLTKGIYYNDNDDEIYYETPQVILFAINDNQELLWQNVLDVNSLEKGLAINDDLELVLFGRTNEELLIDSTTVPRSANTHLAVAYDFYNGESKWLKYVLQAKYENSYLVDGDQVITGGSIYGKVDFKDGFIDSTDQNSGNFYKPYIWSIGITRIPQGDISDSLWSIKEASFDYIDTIDFGNVYLGVKKDSLVERFIFQTAPFDLEIKSITIDSPNFTSDFSGPINLQNSLDVTFRFNPNQGGSDIGRGTISTNQGDYYFYLIGESVDLIWSYKNIEIEFGSLFINDTARQDTTIVYNRGESEITIDSIRIVNDNYDEFGYDILTNEAKIYSLDSLMSQFEYRPKIAGQRNAEAHFYLNVTNNPIVVKLAGFGISRDSVKAKIIVDSTSANPNSIVDMHLKIENLVNPESLDLTKMEIFLSYNATLLLPYRLDNEGVVIDKRRHLVFTLTEDEIKTMNYESRFLATIGNAISTEITIDSVVAYNSEGESIEQLVIDKQNGYFELKGVCFTDGEYRLYEKSNSTTIKIIKENGEYFVNYNLVESGKTKISIYDINGSYISEIISSDIARGEYKTEINTNYISNGNYIIQLETPTEIINNIFTIVK